MIIQTEPVLNSCQNAKVLFIELGIRAPLELDTHSQNEKATQDQTKFLLLQVLHYLRTYNKYIHCNKYY